jgi:hypothetical protein
MTEATHPGNGRRPDPTDPTVLTTQLVDRAVDAFREVMETRLAGMDRATELVAQALQSFRAEADVSQQREQEASLRRVAALSALLETRLGAMDKATELLAATVGRVPSDTDKQVNALRELLESRIDGMDEATKLLATNVREVPSDIDKAFRALREVLQARSATSGRGPGEVQGHRGHVRLERAGPDRRLAAQKKRQPSRTSPTPSRSPSLTGD